MRRAALLLVVASACTCLAPQAQAATVTCGQQLTTSVVVENDLVDCPGDGLVAAAAGITIDLGGHTIDGIGAFDLSRSAIELGAHPGVTVRNGTLRDFHAGVIGRGPGQRVLEMTISSRGSQGVVAGGRASTVAFNRLLSGGVHLGSSDNEVAFNQVAQPGIRVGGSSDGNRIEHNTAASVEVGQFLGGPEGNLVADNTLNAIYITLAGHTTLRRNTVLGGGISVYASRATMVHRNVVVGAPGIGIVLTGMSSSAGPVPTTDTVLLGNTVGRAGADGIEVRVAADSNGGAERTLVRGNTVRRSGDDGIDVEDPTTTLVRNTTRLNADLGIEAVTGVTDGGGNRAFREGNPFRCLGVLCG